MARSLSLESRASRGISATSAGAMNAAVMAHGLTIGGPKGARPALAEFWDGVARVTAPLGAAVVRDRLAFPVAI
jgi:predicted acylesterase/phospholipase RssA